jgi:hypothetical protein
MESDFIGDRGQRIRPNEIMDCRKCGSVREAKALAEEAGFRYMLAPGAKLAWNERVFKITKTNARSMLSIVRYKGTNKVRMNRQYDGLDKRIAQIVRVCHQRCKERETPFDLDADDIIARVKKGRCEETGVLLDLSPPNGHKKGLRIPSLDQVEHQGGYTRDNVRVVCWGFNALRGTAEDRDVYGFLADVIDSLGLEEIMRRAGRGGLSTR